MTDFKTQSGASLGPAAYRAMQWGDGADDGVAREMFQACMDAGIVHFDTALVYTKGRSEEILGDLAGGRDDIFVATKAAYDKGASATNLRGTRIDVKSSAPAPATDRLEEA